MKRVAVGALLLALAAATPGGAATPPALFVRPGLGIAGVRLGATVEQARQALAKRLILDEAQGVDRNRLRYLQYRSRDGNWILGFFGAPGTETLARIVSFAPNVRTTRGIGVGVPVSRLYASLRRSRPVCIQRQPFFNGREHYMRVVSCAIESRGATTAFVGGPPMCATAPLRYQGCPALRIRVGSVMIESDRLRLYKLSWWHPVTIIPKPPRHVG